MLSRAASDLRPVLSLKLKCEQKVMRYSVLYCPTPTSAHFQLKVKVVGYPLCRRPLLATDDWMIENISVLGGWSLRLVGWQRGQKVAGCQKTQVAYISVALLLENLDLEGLGSQGGRQTYLFLHFGSPTRKPRSWRPGKRGRVPDLPFLEDLGLRGLGVWWGCQTYLF